jgi:hypothetical protein
VVSTGQLCSLQLLPLGAAEGIWSVYSLVFVECSYDQRLIGKKV